MEKINSKAKDTDENQVEKEKRLENIQANELIAKPINDGMNTPVPGDKETPIVTGTEAALFKQAENPLGDPDKI